MKISSFYKQAIRTVQFSLAALICAVALNFGTATSALAAQLQVAPTPHLAIFGWGEKAQGKSEVMTGKNLEGSSSGNKGIEQLPKIDAAAAKVAERSSPMGLDEITARSKNGLNEIQGSADASKMHKADRSTPGPAIAGKIEKALDKISK
ncbi:MAG: hypothetical protein LH474_09825 [Chamaesiphon sp.]|nr:hypothetical protein [Chamaesiphon sp.]